MKISIILTVKTEHSSSCLIFRTYIYVLEVCTREMRVHVESVHCIIKPEILKENHSS